MGGQGDNRRLPDHGDRKATPPNHVAIRIAQFLVPDPGQIGKRLEAGDEKRPKEEQVEIVAREDFVDLRRLRAPWAIARRYRGFFFQRFSPPRGGLRLFASPCTHRTNRRWNSIGSRGIAADRDRRGAVVRDPKVLTAVVLDGIQVTLRTRCVVLGLPL